MLSSNSSANTSFLYIPYLHNHEHLLNKAAILKQVFLQTKSRWNISTLCQWILALGLHWPLSHRYLIGSNSSTQTVTQETPAMERVVTFRMSHYRHSLSIPVGKVKLYWKIQHWRKLGGWLERDEVNGVTETRLGRHTYSKTGLNVLRNWASEQQEIKVGLNMQKEWKGLSSGGYKDVQYRTRNTVVRCRPASSFKQCYVWTHNIT